MDLESIPPSLNTTVLDTTLYDIPLLLVILLSIFYGLVSLVTILGNLCVLFLVALSRRMWTVTNFFIANLAIADVLNGTFSVPFQFQAALLQRWVLPAFMCAFCPFVQVLSVNVSVFSLTAIALDRHRAVMSPLRAKTSKSSAKWIICFIWVVGALLGVPNFVALRVVVVMDEDESGVYTKPFCKNTEVSDDVWKVYNCLLVSVQYFVPLMIITALYVDIGMKLTNTETPGNKEGVRDDIMLKNRNKVIHMTYIVVTLFALCWLPLQMYNIFQGIFPDINKYKYINVIWFCCHWLAMSNSCYNPFIYAIYNERFKTEFKKRFGCCLIFFRLQSRRNMSLDRLSSTYA